VLRLAVALVPFVALRLPGKAVAALGALAAGTFYMLLTGSQVPMQRCLGMALLVTLALLSGRRALSLRSLAMAAAGVLMLAPAELLGPSFQMSFAAVLVLIAGHDALRPWLARIRQQARWWRPALLFVLGLMLTSLLAGAATAPPGLHHFGRLQSFGILANAVAVPLTSLLVMPAALIAMLALPLGLAEWPLRVMGWGAEGILLVAREVSSWPGAAPAGVRGCANRRAADRGGGLSAPPARRASLRAGEYAARDGCDRGAALAGARQPGRRRAGLRAGRLPLPPASGRRGGGAAARPAGAARPALRPDRRHRPLRHAGGGAGAAATALFDRRGDRPLQHVAGWCPGRLDPRRCSAPGQ
jgi:ComEC/Rec2-related protein